MTDGGVATAGRVRLERLVTDGGVDGAGRVHLERLVTEGGVAETSGVVSECGRAGTRIAISVT